VLLAKIGRVHPEEANDCVRGLVERVGERRGNRPKERKGSRQRPGNGVRAGDREHLRHLLADRDVQRRCDHEREGQCDGVRAGAVAEQGLERFGDRRLAEETDRDRGECDSELAGSQRLVDLVELLERLLCAGLTLLGESLDPALAGTNERELRGDENAVEEHEQDQQD
jgi:hypothetical protein